MTGVAAGHKYYKRPEVRSLTFPAFTFCYKESRGVYPNPENELAVTAGIRTAAKSQFDRDEVAQMSLYNRTKAAQGLPRVAVGYHVAGSISAADRARLVGSDMQFVDIPKFKALTVKKSRFNVGLLNALRVDYMMAEYQKQYRDEVDAREIFATPMGCVASKSGGEFYFIPEPSARPYFASIKCMSPIAERPQHSTTKGRSPVDRLFELAKKRLFSSGPRPVVTQ